MFSTNLGGESLSLGCTFVGSDDEATKLVVERSNTNLVTSACSEEMTLIWILKSLYMARTTLFFFLRNKAQF